MCCNEIDANNCSFNRQTTYSSLIFFSFPLSRIELVFVENVENRRLKSKTCLRRKCREQTAKVESGKPCHVLIRSDDTAHATERWAFAKVEVVFACYLNVLLFFINQRDLNTGQRTLPRLCI